jgi:hypothetical protein
MSNSFVWMAVGADAVDEIQITAIHWRCEMFNETGKVSESTGIFSLSEPITVEVFSGMDVTAMQQLIFANVNQSEIESALEQTALEGAQA